MRVAQKRRVQLTFKQEVWNKGAKLAFQRIIYLAKETQFQNTWTPELHLNKATM